MPIANGFLTADMIENEYFFELAPCHCGICGMFQLIEQPAPQKMFHENYAFFSSTSRYMQSHFEGFANSVADTYLATRNDPFVVELGSNDGIMLRHFKKRRIRHLGIEPSANVAQAASKYGIETLEAFFDAALADKVARDYELADVILAANVMCHIADLQSVAEGIAQLLKPDGIFVFEDPYLGDMITKTSYDQIYDEHVFIFSGISVSNAFVRHGLELIDAVPQPTHGGSMRYVFARTGRHRISLNVAQLLAAEKAQGLDRIETFSKFKMNCEASRRNLLDTLEEVKRKGKRVVGYGATSKSTTTINYCGITREHIEYISDTTPIKQAKLSPGAHIPVRSYEAFLAAYPDYALLFAWNHAAEIREKETKFTQSGGRWIVYVPKVEIQP